MKKKKDFSKLPKKTILKKEREKHLTRLVKLMILLGQGTVNLDEAAQECNVSKRTILRDIRILEDAGIPLYKPSEKESNYNITEGFSLPHFNVTPKNALEFVDALDALSDVVQKPFKLVEPIQKGVIEAGRKQQKIRQENRGKFNFISTDITKEQFLSAFLYEQDIKNLPPYFTMITLIKIENLLEQDGKNRWYKDWQMKHAERSLIDLSYIGQQYKNVLDDCNQLIEKDPKDLWAYKRAALACYANNNISMAIDYILDGLTQDKKDTELNLYMTFFLIQLKEYERAVSFFTVVEDVPFHSASFASELYAEAGLFDNALKLIETYAKKDSENADVYNKLKADILKRKNAAK